MLGFRNGGLEFRAGELRCWGLGQVGLREIFEAIVPEVGL